MDLRDSPQLHEVNKPCPQLIKGFMAVRAYGSPNSCR